MFLGSVNILFCQIVKNIFEFLKRVFIVYFHFFILMVQNQTHKALTLPCESWCALLNDLLHHDWQGESGQLHLRHTDTTPLRPHFRFADHRSVVDTSFFVNEAKVGYCFICMPFRSICKVMEFYESLLISIVWTVVSKYLSRSSP